MPPPEDGSVTLRERSPQPVPGPAGVFVSACPDGSAHRIRSHSPKEFRRNAESATAAKISPTPTAWSRFSRSPKPLIAIRSPDTGGAEGNGTNQGKAVRFVLRRSVVRIFYGGGCGEVARSKIRLEHRTGGSLESFRRQGASGLTATAATGFLF